MKQLITSLFCVVILFSCNKDSVIDNPDPNPDTKTELPTIITDPYSDFTRFSITVNGTLKDSGSSKIIETGFVVDTFAAPTLEKNLNILVRPTDSYGKMQVIITNIPAGKKYYLRAYARNNKGVAYGNEITFSSLAEKVYFGSITLSTQQEVIEFGRGHYTTINGSLFLTGSITDLAPLKDLAIIDYALEVTNTNQLTTLNGMDSIMAVGAAGFFHGMRFENNTALKELNALKNLTSNNGPLIIVNNDELTDLSGFDNITYNSFGNIDIQLCEKLTSLHGLEKLNWLDGGILISDNPNLTDISAFGNLSVVTWNIRIYGNPALPDLHGFEGLHKLDGLEISGNAVLADISGLINIDSVDNGILLTGNEALRDLTGLKNLKETPDIVIRESPGLYSLNGLQNIKKLSRGITIANTGVTSLAGLENLAQASRLEIIFNEKLKNLQGLNGFTSAPGYGSTVIVSRNDQLESLDGLEKLKNVDGQIYMGFNPLLNNFCALKTLALTGWNGAFILEGNNTNPGIQEIANNCQ
ncbi:hypothetical protein [Flavihumibacter petaseus]|uniref:Receptor L-domain domain-containing protein n=1 Tax=Flavihumibacter petaseus NBRC 106054 TaxID=1220578 RepID=A0A0E9MZY8_9BACT|nr:hypothetical protein [Flavihumibacter petaseus]GAO42695.1 hypothetical protein FPE01S_01_17110 [Flavihumibacter petaseus NBRC 106054]